MARFRYKKTKAKQAQAKLTQIGRLEEERSQAAWSSSRSPASGERSGSTIPPPAPGASWSKWRTSPSRQAGKPLLESATLVVERGEKVGLVGPNGSGKTTLLLALLGGHPFDRGAARLGHGVVPGYFSQHTQELPSQGPSSTAPPPRPG